MPETSQGPDASQKISGLELIGFQSYSLPNMPQNEDVK